MVFDAVEVGAECTLRWCPWGASGAGCRWCSRLRVVAGYVWVAEVDREPVDEGFGVGPVSHLAALVPGERRAEMGLDPVEQLNQRAGDFGCGVAVRQIGEQRQAARSTGECHDRRAVLRADDQVAFPVTGSVQACRFGSGADEADRVEHVTFRGGLGEAGAAGASLRDEPPVEAHGRVSMLVEAGKTSQQNQWPASAQGGGRRRGQ